ncbi:hypothetical protein EG328_008987 [Venturia inaequalis]|uniref:Tachykinin family protein n=1 Tax=Venturia inaequalis TaxID=5025 RepID=A0A8H3YXK1_VENIN|nr:hypothetical protein EG328_008987 [Venturia inaequalis]KAE9975593.1 hypothetical protein EG327_008418 [Venturia inaequalis]
MTQYHRLPEGEEALTGGNASVLLPVLRNPNSVVLIDQPDEPVSPPGYEFLHVRGDGFKPVDVASRKLIRSHVMRNYFQEKNKKAGSNDSSATSAETVNSRDKLKGRWRLGAVDGRPPAPRRKSSTKSTTSTSSGGTSERSCQQFPVLEDTAEEFGDRYDPITDRSCTTQPFPELVTRDDLAMRPAILIERFQCSQVEPFNALPISTTRPSTNRIVHFYSHSFHINSLAVNPTGALYNRVMRDAGLYHAMLSTVSLYMHGHLGIEARQDILFHRGETMKIIHERLANIDNVDRGLLMSTIVTILSFENLCGNYFTAKAHLHALRRLIATSGGIAPYTSNDALPRALAWAEHHYAAAHRTVPPARYEPTLIPSPGFPESLELETAKSCPYSLVDIPEYGHAIYQIFRRIHLLGIATSAQWKASSQTRVDMRVCISNLLLDVEFDMLVLSAQLGKEEKEKDTTTSHDLISVIDILVTGSQIFLFTALRALPVGARVVEIYLSRIVLALNKLQHQQQQQQFNRHYQLSTLLQSWKRVSTYESLLWGLFMGMVAATNRPEKESIAALIREVVAVLGIKSQESLESHLKGMAWAEFFELYSKEVGRDILRSRRSIG